MANLSIDNAKKESRFDKTKKYATDPGILCFVGHSLIYSQIATVAFPLSIVSLGVAVLLKADQLGHISVLKRLTSRFDEKTKIGKFLKRDNAPLAINGVFLIGVGLLSGSAALSATKGEFLKPFLGSMSGLAYGFGNIGKANEIDNPAPSEKKSSGILTKAWRAFKKPETLSCIASVALAVVAAGPVVALGIVAVTIAPALYLSITSRKNDQKMIEGAASEKMSRSAQSRQLIMVSNFLSSVTAFVVGNPFVGLAQALFGTANGIVIKPTDKKEKERIGNLAKEQAMEKGATGSNLDRTLSMDMSPENDPLTPAFNKDDENKGNEKQNMAALHVSPPLQH